MRRQLFDEILVNAVDHKQRDASVTRIDVDIKQGTSSSPPVITVYNDGSGIPVKKHKAEGAPKRLPYKVPIVLTASRNCSGRRICPRARAWAPVDRV